MLTRAIEPDAASAAGPLVVAIAPTVTIAAMATSTAATRQKVSLRRSAAAIDDHVRIERHRNSPEMISAFCISSVSEALSDYINCDAI